MGRSRACGGATTSWTNSISSHLVGMASIHCFALNAQRRTHRRQHRESISSEVQESDCLHNATVWSVASVRKTVSIAVSCNMPAQSEENRHCAAAPATLRDKTAPTGGKAGVTTEKAGPTSRQLVFPLYFPRRLPQEAAVIAHCGSQKVLSGHTAS